MSRTINIVTNKLGVKPWSDPQQIADLINELIKFFNSNGRVGSTSLTTLAAIKSELLELGFLTESSTINLMKSYETFSSMGFTTAIKF